MPEQVLRGSRATHLAPHGQRPRRSSAPGSRWNLLLLGWLPAPLWPPHFQSKCLAPGCSGQGKFPTRPQRSFPVPSIFLPTPPWREHRSGFKPLPVDSRGNPLDTEGFLWRVDSWLQVGGAGAGFAPSELPRWDCREQSLPRPGEHPASSRSLSGPRCALRALTAGSSLAGSPPSRALALSSSWPSQRELRRHTIDLCVGLNHFYLVCHHGSFAEKAASLPREAGSGGRL